MWARFYARFILVIGEDLIADDNYIKIYIKQAKVIDQIYVSIFLQPY